MARKSRKNIDQNRKKENEVSCWRVGFYLRLSDKEEGKGSSESIENQRELLTDYLKGKPDFKVVATFIDDGKTGTNFKRSGFEEMLEAAKSGVINCIIVKDLSRFGRNYLEEGNYIENIFPFFNIRFIAVTDHFDTLTATSSQLAYLIPLKNMMNENYARDISKKERSAKKILRKKGAFLGTHAVYGYQKSQEDKHILVIDEEAAVHVREIYNMCENGHSDAAIAKYLNRNQVSCPSRYKYEKGLLHHEKYDSTSGWYPQTVASILTNRAYVGDMVQGKRICREIKGKKECAPREEWDIVSGTHEPIITMEQFEQVQQIRSQRREKYRETVEKRKYSIEPDIYDGILKEKIFCSDCGKAMQRKYIKSCKDHYRYICEGHERNGTCTRKYLRETELIEALKTVIVKRLEVSCEIREWIETQRKNIDAKLEQWVREYDDLEQRAGQKLKMKALLYKDWKEGIIDKEEYLNRKARYEREMEQCREEQEKIMSKKQEYVANFTHENPSIQALSELTLNSEVTKNLIRTFVERVEVYEQNRIKVTLCYQNEFDKILKYWEEGRCVVNEE